MLDRLWAVVADGLSDEDLPEIVLLVHASSRLYCRVERIGQRGHAVALSVGLVAALNTYCRARVANDDPALAAAYTDEASARDFAANLVLDMAQHHRRRGVIAGRAMPLTPMGEQRATQSTVVALTFLVLHELAHVSLKHFTANPTESDCVSADDRHSLETAADSTAIEQLLDLPTASGDAWLAVGALFEMLDLLVTAVPDPLATHAYPIQRLLTLTQDRNPTMHQKVMEGLSAGPRGRWYFRNS